MNEPNLLQLFSGAWFIFVGVFFLGASIFVHELGHFLAARWRGLKVLRFSIGFGPALFRWTGRDGVDYRLSILPFGGYVALPQLADMGRLEGDETPANAPGSSPASLPPAGYLDKMIALVMGAVFNLLFALVLASILWTTGQEVVVSQQMARIGAISPTLPFSSLPDKVSPAAAAGLQPGDEVLRIDGAPIRSWQDLTYRIVTGLGRDGQDRPVIVFTIRREGREFDVTIYPSLEPKEGRRYIGISPIDLFLVDQLVAGGPAEQAGFRQGDLFRSLDGQPIYTYGQIRPYLQARPDHTPVFTIERDGALVDIPFRPALVRDPATSFEHLEWSFIPTLQTTTVYLNPATQFLEKMELFYLTFRALLTPSSDVELRNMSGPVGIVDTLQYAARIGIKQLIWFLVFININLAILNLLPIPVLDGGHMLFATIARLRGRPIPLRILESTQAVFVVLLLGFMLYVTVFDVLRLKDRIFPEPPPATANP